MPCKKCKDEKYKYGNTGECKYATKEACEKANPKKYNKMMPTPLGKKSYEEYEKELKEFNLSKVERVELGELQDLEKLLNASLGIRKKGNKLALKAEEGYTDIRKGLEDVEFLTEKRAKEQKKVDDNKKLLSGTRSDLFQQIQQLEANVNKADVIVNGMKRVEKELGITVPGIKEATGKLANFKTVIQSFIDSYDTTIKGL